MQQLWFIDKPITQHVSGTTVPIFRSARLYTTAYGWLQSKNSLYTVHTTCLPASQDSSKHFKCWKPYAVIYGLALLKMDTMVHETCWCWPIGATESEESIILVITNLMHKILFYNEFIISLYMFRALCAHHQKVKIVLYSIWYHHTL